MSDTNVKEEKVEDTENEKNNNNNNNNSNTEIAKKENGGNSHERSDSQKPKDDDTQAKREENGTQGTQSQPIVNIKRRGLGSHNFDPNQIIELHKRNTHWKKQLQEIVTSKTFDIFIIILVIVYTVLVFILFALDNDENADNDAIQTVIRVVEIIEMIILGIFMLEILLKNIVVGVVEYFRDSWLLFDAIVIVASVILLSLDLTLNNDQFSTISKILRGIFRFLRLYLVFRKVNQYKKISITHSRFAQKTPVEAILEIMNNLKENVDDLKYIQDIDYAIEMISDNRLYEPIVQKGDQDAENWIGTYADPKKEVQKKKGKKSSKNQLAINAADNNNLTTPAKTTAEIYNNIELPERMQKHFEQIDTLDFKVFEFHEQNTEDELGYLLVYLLQRYDCCQKMKIDPQVLFSFGNRISNGYFPNHYHNKIHAFDVTQTVHFFMSTCNFINVGNLTPLEITTMYISAACHDYEQGGLNNIYLINTRDQLAIRYNDKSPLENHHLSQTFFILKEQDYKYNFAQNFSKDDFKRFRDRMITMVLATDMQNHFTDQAKLKGRLAAEFDPTEKDKALCMETILHAADVSNPIKPFSIYEIWATRVLNEFWDQGDREREKGLSITYLCDRYTTNKSKSQIGFIDFIVKPYYETIKNFLPMLEPFLANFESNKEEWKNQQQHWEDNLKQLCQERDEKEKANPPDVKTKK